MNIGIITQARTTSNRLPAKILLKVKSQTFLEHHISRLKSLDLPIIIATTVNSTDDIITQIATEQDVKFYRGDEHDVLARFYFCAKENNLKTVIRVTSDCPLVDAEEIQKGLDNYLKSYNLRQQAIYLSNTLKRSFPKGMDFEIFSFAMLEKAFLNATQKQEREHVTPYFYNGNCPNIHLINSCNIQDSSDLRLTLDYQEDYAFLKVLIEKHDAHLMNVLEIEKLIYGHLELQDLNQKCKIIAST